MADGITNLDLIDTNEGQPEVPANALFDAMSHAALFGRRAETTAGLTFGYYGGRINSTSVANGTVLLTANNTNYVVVHRSTFAVSASTATTNWNDTTTYGRAYKLVTGASTITDASTEDHRFGASGILATGSGGAPSDPQYLLVANHSGLTNDRALAVGTGLSLVDGGAGSSLTISLSGLADTAYLLDSLFSQRVWGARAAPQMTAFAAIGGGTLMMGCEFVATAAGGTTGPWTASGDYYATAAKTRFESAGALDNSAGGYLRSPSSGSLFVRGAGSGGGGFYSNTVCGFGALNATSRIAIGISSGGTVAAAGVQPSADTDLCIFGCDSGDTNMQIMHNDGSGAATKIDLGASWPRPTVETSIYWVQFSCAPSGSTIAYYVKRLNDGQVASGTLSTNLPAAGTALVAQMRANTGPATSTAVKLDAMAAWGNAPY